MPNTLTMLHNCLLYFCRMNCKDAIYDHACRISNIESTGRGLCTRAEVDEGLARLQEVVAEDIMEVRRSYATLEYADKIAAYQRSAGEKLGAVETALALKMDKIELDRVDALAARLSSYDVFKTESLARLARLEAVTTSLGEQCVGTDQLLRTTSERVSTQAADMSKLAPKTEVRLVAKELERQAAVLERAATSGALLEVRPVSIRHLPSIACMQ